MERAADEAVLTAIHRDMETNNFSKKIIDRTFVGSVDVTDQGKKITVDFISDYIADTGFDVSKAREEGTSNHDVRPTKPGGVLRWAEKTGGILFRNKSRPKGIERLLMIEITLQKNQTTINEKISENIADSARRVLGV